MMIYRLFGIFVLVLTLAGCNLISIDDLAHTAVVQTRIAHSPRVGTSPNLVTLTLTITANMVADVSPSRTPAPPTAAVTVTPTPVIGIIDQNPRNFLLDEYDLPPEPNYYVPASNWISPQRNYEVIYELGEEIGQEYIDRTGRLDGWWVTYKRGKNRVIAPEEIYHNIVKYKTAEGARLTVEEFNLGTKDDRYQYHNLDQILGDLSVVMVMETTREDGEHQITYRIETAYRNFVSVVMVVGQETEVDYEFVVSVAWNIIQKLKQAPLTLPSSVEQAPLISTSIME